jgi:hypothetical protein
MKRGAVVGIAGVWLVSAVALTAHLQTPAQTPAQPPVFRSTIDVVQLDVSVLDKKRKPVRGLTAADFTVTENGKAQKIIAVSEVSIDDEVVPPPVWARAAPPDVATNDVDGKRLLAIVIDTSRFMRFRPVNPYGPPLPVIENAEAKETVWLIARKVLDHVTPDDLVCVVYTSGLWARQPFTNDFNKLVDAVDRIKPGLPPPPLPTSLDDLTPPYTRLRELAEYLGAVPQRRKAIVYISPGRPLIIGANDLSEIIWSAQRSNVNIYAINPFSLGPFERATARSRAGSRTEYLTMLAEKTGGTAIIDPAKIDPGLDQLFLENGSYYIVGYQTSNPAMDGKYRKLDVKINRGSEYIVRRRTEMYRPKAQGAEGVANAFMPSAKLWRGLSGLLPNLDVTFEVAAMPFAQPGPKALVPLVIGLAEPVLTSTTRVRQRMEVRATAYDERGEIRADVTETARLDEAPGPNDQVHYDVLAQLQLVPGRYSVRVVAHNGNTDKLGSIEFDLSVPDFARDTISISGVALSAASVAETRAFGVREAILPIVPTALRSFRSSDRVTAFARIYEGGTDPIAPATLDVRITDARGTVVSTVTQSLAVDRFDVSRAADWNLALPVDRLPSGVYLLTLQASLGARKTLQRDVRFTVR